MLRGIHYVAFPLTVKFRLDCRQEAGDAMERYVPINKVVLHKQEDEDEKYSGEKSGAFHLKEDNQKISPAEITAVFMDRR